MIYPMHAVHIRTSDATTGHPTPVRLCISTLDGVCFPPLGRAAEFPTGRNEDVGGQLRIGRERWYSIDGSCEMPLPAGVPLRVRATKGPEFSPIDETVTLGAGQMALRFTIEHLADLRAQGWASIDARCHFLTPHAALLEAAAEGLDVVNLLATPFATLARDGNTYTTATNLLAWSGQTAALERDGRIVVVNTLNSHPVLGSVALLHSHRPVFPLASGGEETDDWSICDWCDQCHRKGGLTVWVDAFEPAGGIVGGEALVAAILGKIDAIEVTGAPRKMPLLPWVYRLWDAGFLIPLVGASGKDSNRIALGSTRTYVLLNGQTWVDAIRSGRSVVTDGPLLSLDHNRGRVEAALRNVTPASRVEIVSNGRIVAQGEAKADWLAEVSGWVAARGWEAGRLAHTSPVRLPESTSNPEARRALKSLAEQTREWIDVNGRFANPKRKTTLLATCDAAIARLTQSA
jgi:hypothetical protein